MLLDTFFYSGATCYRISHLQGVVSERREHERVCVQECVCQHAPGWVCIHTEGKGPSCIASFGISPLHEPQTFALCFFSSCICFAIFVWMKIVFLKHC